MHRPTTPAASAPTLALAVAACALGSLQPVHAETTELEEVTVEASSQSQSIESELPMGTALSGETLRTLPGSAGDPIKGLQALPGMYFTDDSEGEPAVRGSSPDDNVIEIDHLPVGYLFHVGGIISVFNANLVESFQVYPSAYGPEFAGATGAAIDVRLRDPKSDRLQGSVDISILQAGGLIEGPLAPGHSFYLAGRMSYLDLLVGGQLDKEDGIEFTEFPKYTDYQGKYVWHTGPDSVLRLQITGATDEYELFVYDDAEDIATEPLLAGRHYDKETFHQQGVTWENTFNNGMTLLSAFAHHRDSGEAQMGDAGLSDYSVDGLTAKSHLTIPLNEAHDLKLGLQARRLKADVTLAFNDPGCTEFEPDCSISGAERLNITEQVKLNTLHAFVKDSWYLNDKLTVFPSLVLQSDDLLDKQYVDPRFSLEYSHTDDLIFTAGTGVYRSMPGYFEINEVFGNPDLDYVESLHGVVGVQRFFDKGLEIKTELYYKDTDKLITADDDTRYANNGEGTAYGLDTLVRKTFSDKLSGWMSLSLSQADRRHKVSGNTFDFSHDQPVNMSLVANYKISPKWTAGAKLWVHSGSPYTPVLGATESAQTPGLFDPIYGKINSERHSLYHRLDLRFDRVVKRASGRTMSTYFEINNLLGTKNISGFDYNADYSERTDIEQLPRLISLGFKADF